MNSRMNLVIYRVSEKDGWGGGEKHHRWSKQVERIKIKQNRRPIDNVNSFGVQNTHGNSFTKIQPFSNIINTSAMHLTPVQGERNLAYTCFAKTVQYLEI